MHIQNLFLLALAVAAPIQAHPGHDHTHEAAVRARYLQENPRSLRHCAAKLRARGHASANLKRRQALAESLKQKRGLEGLTYLQARDVDTVLGTSHESNNTSLNLETDPKTLFEDESSCILQPESTEGPYYVTGELIRTNITNGEAGVPLVLDIQIIDTSNCEPVSNVYLEAWHCNTTGVYGGVVERGNGNAADESNINNTAFRGVQKTNTDGIVQFETVFPGHYAGRTNHIHIMTHQNNSVTVNDNGTLTGFVASHVGQIFFDQSLQEEVEKVEPYASNDQRLTTNEEDQILAGEADSADPIMRYVKLGNDISEGILGWISVGIDPTATRDVEGGYYAGDASNASGSGSTDGTASGSGSGTGSSSADGAANTIGSTSGGSRILPAFGWFMGL